MTKVAWLCGSIILATCLTVSELDAEFIDASEAWNTELVRIEKLLQGHESRKALKASRSLSETIVNTNVLGASVHGMLAKATAFRAIALAERKKERDAVWFWCVAKQLDPVIADLDFSKYGERAGALLSDTSEFERDIQQTDHPEPNEVPTEPRILKKVSADYPDAKAVLGVGLTVVVEATIGTDGRLRNPRIVEDKGHPTMAFTVLEALKDWRFSPSKLNGKAVEVSYVLRARF